MNERFSPDARRAVLLAQEEARRFNHKYVSPAHILLGLLRVEEGIGAKVLSVFGGTYEAARKQFDSVHGPSRAGEEVSGTELRFSPDAKRVLETALREAIQLSHKQVGTEHLLLALIRLSDGFPRSFLMWLTGPSGLNLSTLGSPIDDEIRREVVRLAKEAPSAAPRESSGTVTGLPNPSTGTVKLHTGAVRVKALLRIGPLCVDVRKSQNLETSGEEVTTLVATGGKRFASLQMKLKTGTLRSEHHRSLLRLVS